MIHLRGDGTDAVIDVDTGAPVVVHWGAPLGVDIDASGLAALTSVPSTVRSCRARPTSSPRSRSCRSTAPGSRAGPGCAATARAAGHGRPASGEPVTSSPTAGSWCEAIDPVARLRLTTTFELGAVLVVRTALTNEGDDRYMLDGLSVTLPLPEHAGDLLTFHGRCAREFQPRRQSWPSGAVLAENWRGRTSHEHPPVLFAGTAGFGEWQGEVWGAHLAWSGNHTCSPSGSPTVGGTSRSASCCTRARSSLEPGESYSTPEVIAVHSDDGLTPATWGFHRSPARRGRATHDAPARCC